MRKSCVFWLGRGSALMMYLTLEECLNWFWMQRIKEENKTVALGTRCKKGRHRLRTRSGHCIQCDPRKLAFQTRFSTSQYIYIAGSLSEELLKIGICVDWRQREHQLRSEKYGSAGD